ncbi:autotransporter outer membrane beta-barrel domain-containing protein [Massilia endophytica]|uniref:hypothetical protein n=1 Tax=Massilia endophytica TaxID=2899220 RepID=UPI001E2C0C8A|nr:hypothetical protein [Massilia endophytica]UGQ45076.1 hypothetical protein LSQ66_14880 [Massilia endophytica]
MTDIVAPAPIDELPVGPSTDDPDNFDDEADDWVAALPGMVQQTNAATAATYQNALAAAERANAAQSAAGVAVARAEEADSASLAAEESRDQAVAAANSLTVSAELAQNWATKTDAEVEPGQGYGAKKYATDAADAALAAQGYAASASPRPIQAGNAGKFLRTNGITESWEFAGISEVLSVATTDFTFTGVYQYLPVQMATKGKSAKLPDATSLTPGGPMYIIDNSLGEVPAGIRNNAGTLIGAMAAGGIAYVSLKTAGTQAGVWSITGTGLEAGLVVQDTPLPATYGGTVAMKANVVLDSDTSVHFVQIASNGFAAILVDNAGKVVSTPLTISAASGDVPAAAWKVTSTQFIVFYGPDPGQSLNTTNHRISLVNVSGTSPSRTMSIVSSPTLTTGSIPTWGGEDSTGASRLVQLSATSYLCGYVESSNVASAVAIQVSGNTATIGSPVPIPNTTTQSTLIGSQSVYLCGSNVLMIFGNVGTGFYEAVMLTVSNTTTGKGAVVATGMAYSGSNSTPVAVFSATRALMLGNNSGTTVGYVYLAISALSIVPNSFASLETGLTFEQGYSSSNLPANRFTPRLFPVSASAVMAIWTTNTGLWRMTILTDTGTGIGVSSSDTMRNVSAATAGGVGSATLLPPGTAEFVTVAVDGVSISGTVAPKYRLVPYKVTGTAITTGTHERMEKGCSYVAASLPHPAVRMSSGVYVMGMQPGSDNPSSDLLVFSSNGEKINMKGSISVPGLVNVPHNICTPSTSRIVLVASAAGGAAGLTSGNRIRVLNVEIAA